MPRRLRHAAVARPAGPAPTISAGSIPPPSPARASAVVVIGADHSRETPPERPTARARCYRPRMKLVIGNKNYSSWSLRPWLLLSHLEIPFEEEKLSFNDPAF